MKAAKKSASKEESDSAFKNPELYKKENDAQRNVTKTVITELANKLNWREGGQDTLIDIGSGTGDALIDFVLPLLKKRNFAQLIGTDISEKMIEHCQNEYSALPNVVFEILDISKDIKDQKLKYSKQPVDHVTSFYTFHWIKDQKQAFKNIYNLLKPGGDCLLVFASQTNFLKGFEVMKNDSKWAEYMPADLSNIITPYQHSENPKEEMETLLKKRGFSKYDVENRHVYHDFKNFTAIRSKFILIFSPI